MSDIKREKTKTIDLGVAAIWGKLVPLTPGLPTHELSDLVVIIGRLKECDIQINDKRLSGKHCKLEKKDDQILLTDLSTNGTYIKDAKVGKNVEKQVQNGNEIWLLPASRVKPTEALGFKLEIIDGKKVEEEEQFNNKEDEIKKKEEEAEKQKKAKEQKAKNDGFSQSIKDQITCSFCFEIMHGPVNVQPCNHRFCGGCLAELVQAKKGDCIQCRKPILTATKDSSFNSIIDDYLKTHPEDKRDQNDIDELNKKNIFTFDPTDIVQLISGKSTKKAKAPPATTTTTVSARGRGRRTAVRASSDLSASDDDSEAPRCRQCMNERNGFRCGPSQKHVRCFTCGKMMADREDKDLHQYCVLCTQYCCNIYYPPCGRGVKLQLLKDKRNECKIDTELLRGNRFEFQALRNYLLTKKWTSKELFDEIMKFIRKKQFSYLLDRKIMRAPPVASRQVKIQENDAVCDLCWKQLWFQMVFFYRIKIQADLPSAVRDRPVCYWGINCRTMDHNADHAKKYNHIVHQTRF